MIWEIVLIRGLGYKWSITNNWVRGEEEEEEGEDL